LESEDLTEDQKKEVLSEISRNMLSTLADIKGCDVEEAKRAVKKCHDFATDIIKVAAQSHRLGTLYQDIQLVHDAPVEHSGAVSTFAVMFALGMGYSDKALLMEISLGGLLHDIGHLSIEASALKVPESLREPDHKVEYETHVLRAFEILQEREIEFTPNVHEIIEQHHERYDGHGFPNKTQGFELNELAQLVAISDWFDRLMNGTEDGTSRAPSDAIEALCQGPNDGTPYNPELFATIAGLLKEAKDMSTERSTAKAQTHESLKLLSGKEI
jgi:HD-GYP domain-containing protein (c-di-GMP phosphodiesterase class II)